MVNLKTEMKIRVKLGLGRCFSLQMCFECGRVEGGGAFYLNGRQCRETSERISGSHSDIALEHPDISLEITHHASHKLE